MKRLLWITLAIFLLAIPMAGFAAHPTTDHTGPWSAQMWRSDTYSKDLGYGMAFGGLTTGSANNDTIYIAAYDYSGDGSADFVAGGFEELGIDNYISGGAFLLGVCMTADSAAPLSEVRPIVGFDASEGMVIVSPAFSASVGADEYVMVIHRSVIGKQPGLSRYSGVAALITTGDELGTLQTAVDSVYVTDLAGFGNDYFNRGDYWFHYLKTTDGAAPQDEWRKVLDYVSASGLFTFEYDFSVTATALDLVELVHESLVPDRARNGWSDWTEIVIDFSSATWNTAATHELITGTGDYEIEIAAACSTNCASTSSDSLWFFMGESGATGYRMVSFLFENAGAGENLIPTNWSQGYIWSAAALTVQGGGTASFTVSMGKDIGFEISDHAATGGIVCFWYRWRPLSGGGKCANGAGGTL